MDGAAIAVGLASTPCADWLKEVIPNKTGLRLKVHSALKSLGLRNQVSLKSNFAKNANHWGVEPSLSLLPY